MQAYFCKNSDKHAKPRSGANMIFIEKTLSANSHASASRL